MNTVGIEESNWTTWTEVESPPKFSQFWFENIDINYWHGFAKSYLGILLLSEFTIYFGGIWWLTRIMSKRQPLQLRIPLCLWNAAVGIMSIFVMSRISSELFVLLSQNQGFYRSLCIREGLHMSTAYWSMIFALSKPMFMIDTFFLILRKKPVDAVHVVHHSMAIIFSPILAMISEPLARWLIFANLVVHSVDYSLLAFRALQISIPKSRQIMAALEVAQMLFVLLLSAYTLFLRVSGVYCLRHPNSVSITYFVYFGLLIFLAFTMISPEYWKRGIPAKAEKRAEKNNFSTTEKKTE